MKILSNLNKPTQILSPQNTTTVSFRGGNHNTKTDSFMKSEPQNHTREELQQRFIELDFYKKDAKKMSKRTDIFTPENIKQLSKIDFSGFKTKTEERHKYFLLYNLEKPQKVKDFLKAINPIKKDIFAEDLEYTSKEATNYIYDISKKPQEINLSKYLKLTKHTCGILEGPYDLLKERGFNETNIERFYEINEVLYGKQPAEQKKKLKQFEKDTEISLMMDYDLPAENIEYVREYVREFVNIEKASGGKIAPVIILTKYLDAYGSYCYGNYILCEPIVQPDGTVCEEQFATLQHENTHYLDEANINKTAKPKESYFYDKPNLKSIVSAFISTYSTKDRDEFVAEFRSFIQSNRMQKYADENGGIHYRYKLNQCHLPSHRKHIKTKIATAS